MNQSLNNQKNRGIVSARLSHFYPLYIALSSTTAIVVITTLMVWGIKLILNGSWLMGLVLIVMGIPLVLANTQTLGAAALMTVLIWVVSIAAGWQLYAGNVFLLLVMILASVSIAFSLLALPIVWLINRRSQA